MSRVPSHNYTLIPNNSGAADGRAKCLPSALITRGRGTDYAATRRAGGEAADWLSTPAETFQQPRPGWKTHH